ncbi:MAG: ZIP family metal transporter [Haliscomenobacter sp.]
MQNWELSLLFLVAVLGGTAAIPLHGKGQRVVGSLTSLSGAYLLGLAVTHLIPDLFQALPGGHPERWILAGFTLQLLLEPLSMGIEHGHFHRMNQVQVFPIMLGLIIHALLEGLPLGGYQRPDTHLHGGQHMANQLLFGIMVHKGPAAFALGSLLSGSGMGKRKVFLMIVIFALSTPIGVWIAGMTNLNPNILQVLLAMVTGSFLHLSTSILFESGQTPSHHISWLKLLAIVAGFILALVSS